MVNEGTNQGMPYIYLKQNSIAYLFNWANEIKLHECSQSIV
jgi:hypothetical protein